MRMLRDNAPQLRSDYSAGYHEAMHSGCAGTRHSGRTGFPVGRIEFQISLAVRPPQLAASFVSNTRLAVVRSFIAESAYHSGLFSICEWCCRCLTEGVLILICQCLIRFRYKQGFADLKFLKEHS